jgi:hypothetical protein
MSMIDRKRAPGRNYLKPWMLLVVSFVAVVCYITPSLYRNYFGFCPSQERVLTDQEKVNAVVEFIIHMRVPAEMPKPVGIDSVTNDVIAYSSVAEFLSINPECCEVSKEFYSEGARVRLGAADRLCGRVADYVTARYLIRYRDSSGAIKSKPVEAHYPVSPCGNIADLM